MSEQLINPITQKKVDEVITEKEANLRGYRTLEFRFKHLEDENENFEHYIIEGKEVIVKLNKPHLNYKKPVAINHERVLDDNNTKKVDNSCVVSYTPNSNDGEECLSCSG